MIITEINPKIERAARNNPIVRAHLQNFLDCSSSWDEAIGDMVSELVATNKALLRRLEGRRQKPKRKPIPR